MVGTVYLVGAGPGDPELMTLRGMRLLQTTDVVVHDRLIPHEVLAWCRPTAQQIDVGKYPDHHRVSQTEINELLVQHALKGKQVVRLKGGDPFVLGRGYEELLACHGAEVPCEVVPGISSCIAAPSAAGIPVTSRGIGRNFVVITGQTNPDTGDGQPDYAALAQMDTIIVLMGRKILRSLVCRLIEAGLNPTTPAACIENATLPHQRVISGQAQTIADLADQEQIASPVVTVMGQVASLAKSQGASRKVH